MADFPDYMQWVEIAESDIRAVHVLAASDSAAFAHQVLFHCQQCAEKYLKACLRSRDLDFPKVHDFERRLRKCEQLPTSFAPLGEPTARLQPFAVEARYSLRRAERSTVDQALADATTVRDFCRRFMALS